MEEEYKKLKEEEQKKKKDKQKKKQKEAFLKEQKKKIAEYKEKKRITEELLANANLGEYGSEEDDDLSKYTSALEKG